MTGWNFPKIFKGNAVDVITGKQCAVTHYGLLINSELFEFRFDPGYGSNVMLLLYKPDTPLSRDLLVDAIYDGQMFFPNVRFDRNQVQIEKSKPGELSVTIPMIIDNQTYANDIQLYINAKS